jgi:hypothetical protein
MSWTETVPQKVTPEEKLLKLIESGGEDTRRFVFWDVRTWAALFFPRRQKAKRLAVFRFTTGLAPRGLNLRLINQGLMVLLVFLVAGIALNMNRIQPSLKDLSSRVVASGPLGGEEQALASLGPLADYLRVVEERDLFHPVLPPKPKELEPKAEPVKPEATRVEILREKAKTLKLVGISWGKVPVAMIEDTTKRETSFLKAGQFINEIQVKAILKDRAILSDGDAEYDLF